MSTTTVTGYPTPDDNDTPDNVRVLRPHVTDAADPGKALAPKIYDAEVVNDTATATDAVSGGALEPRPAGTVAARKEKTRAGDPLGKAAARVVGRALWQFGKGHVHWGRQAWAGMTFAVIREQITTAKATGDQEALREWVDRLEHAKAARRARLVGAPAAIAAAVRAVLLTVVILAGLLLLSGIALTLWADWTWQDWYTVFIVTGGHVVVLAVMSALIAGLVAAPVTWAIAAYRTGGRGDLPQWAISPAKRDTETMIVTPVGIAQALAHLGIPALSKAIKDGWTVQFSTPPVRVNNRGYQCVFSLPMGVTVDMVINKREVLARNLNRAVMEVWPTESEQAGYVDLWVSDPGSTGKGAPEYPLLHAGTCDIFTGVPLGVSQRGDQISPALVEANIVFGGMMGQGKSNAARVKMAGAALDPLAELWVYVFAGNGDFDAYQPRLSRYERGTGDDVAAAALDALKELYAEVGRREERLAELGAKKVTRGVAEKHHDLRPIVALFSECHELFGHPEFGKEAADYAVQTLRRARKTGIILGFDTQSSRADAIPPKIVELVKLNACFAVKTWRSNDGFLGDGSFQAGIRATELRPGKDRGTSVLTGATEERFEILSWYYIPADDESGWDAATDLIARAIRSVHHSVPLGVTRAERPAIEAQDHLADVNAVMRGEKRVRTQIVLTRLAELHPGVYEGWSFGDLAAALDEHGIEPRKSDGVKVVRLEDVRDALTQRDSESGGDEGI